MSIDKRNIPYPNTNSSEENEKFLKWCFSNGSEGKDLWSQFSYKSQNNEPINLIGANLDNLNLQGVYLPGVKLGGANLNGSVLTSANLFEANLVGANLTQTQLSHANLNEADFFKANLTNTNFTNAYLKNAYFKDAKINDTIFDKADLEGTNIDMNNNSELEIKSLVENENEQDISIDKELIINSDKNQYASTLGINPANKDTVENFVSEIHGSLELRGKTFHKNIDLRDIIFYTSKISNILKHTFNITNTSKLLKNNFNITLGKIEEDTLNLNLNLDFGLKLPPLLLNKHMQIWDIASVVIDTLKSLGENFNNNEMLKIFSNDNIKDDVIISNNHGSQFVIPNHIYKIIHNTLEDIMQLNLKIHNKELEYVILNDKELMSIETYEYIYKGIDIFNKIKEHQINDTFQAQIEVFEFNTQTQQGKAKIYNANYKDAVIYEETDFEVDNESIEKILDSMHKNTILVNFKPVIDNFGNKKLLKKMILTL